MTQAGKGRAGRTGQGAFQGIALALVLSLLALMAILPALAVTPAQAAPRKVAENPADAPVRRLQTLLTRKATTKEQLRRVEAELEQARSARPDGPSGAKAGFFLARAQEEIAKKSGVKADWFKAAESFGAYLERFPRDNLAYDALYRRGLIRLERLSDPDGALADFRAILRAHPRSQRAAQARSLERAAHKAAQAQPAQTQAAASKKAEPAPPPPAAGDKPDLLDIRHKNEPRGSRVVLDLNGRVRYKYQLLEHQKTGAARVYIDLLGAHLGKGVQEDIAPTGGILRRIRASQREPDTVRVVFDFSELKDYTVQVLDAPFRLVLDATGTQEAKAAPVAPVVDDLEPPHPTPNFAAPKGSRKRLAANLVEQLGLSVRTIMIDPGHGGKDPGARGFGLMEKDVNLRMALILGKMLKEHGYRVLYTRTTDVFLALEERTALANAKKADLFVSVHCNAHTDPSMSGLETYSLNLARTPDAVRVAARENAVSDKNISDLQMILTDLMLTSKIKESVDLARGMQKQVLSAIRTKWTVADHGNREAPFFVLMGAKMPSTLIEIGYITNKTEAARLKTDVYLRILARGICDGINEYKQQIERYTVK